MLTQKTFFIFALLNLENQGDFINYCTTKSLISKRFYSFLPYKISRIKKSKTSLSADYPRPAPHFLQILHPPQGPGTHNSDYILGLRLRSLLTVKYKDVSPTSWPGLPNLLQVRVPHVVYREQEYVLVFITACLDLKTSQNVVLCLQNCLDT